MIFSENLCTLFDHGLAGLRRLRSGAMLRTSSGNAMGFPMRSSRKIVAIAALFVAGTIVHAAPPTVVPSPGYDARLQEQRSAAAKATSPEAAPVAPRRHKKPKGN
jgi:hypothetical protein